MRELRYNTATTVVIGPLVAIADGYTTVDAATAADIDCGLVKHATTTGAAKALTASGVGTTDFYPATNNPGHYIMEIEAAETDTLGRLRYTFNDVDVFVPIWADFKVITQAEYDRKYSTGATVDEIKAAVVTNAAGTDIAADIIALKAETVLILADTDVIDDGTSGLVKIASDVAAILVDTAVIGALGVGLTALATQASVDTIDGIVDTLTTEMAKIPKSDAAVTWNATALAAIQSEANDALVALNLDHLCAVATVAADMTAEVIDLSILSRILGNGDTSTFVPSTDGLHAAGVDLDAILADTVSIDSHITADYGATEKAAIDLLDDAAGGLMDIHTDVAAVKAETAAILTDTAATELAVDAVDTLVNAIVDTYIPAVKADTAAILVDTGTTLQAELDAIQAAVITNAAGTDIAADIIAIKAETVSILADTNELQTDWADAGRLDAILDIIAADTTTDIPATIAAVKAETALIVADTNELQTDWVNGGRLDLILDTIAAVTAAVVADAVWDELQADHVIADSFGEQATIADINATMDEALADIHLDHLLAANYDPASKPGVATALLNEIVESDGGISRFTVNALENSPAGVPASTIAAAVWDETLPGSYGAGTAGYLLDAAGVAADPWATALPGAYGAGTAGQLIGKIGAPVAATISADIAAAHAAVDNVDTDVGVVDALVDAIKLKTDELPTDPADASVVAGLIAALQAVVDNIHDTDLPAVKTDTAAILVDTNELQTDWADGGRLDLILDAATAPSAAVVAAAVWAEVLEDVHTAADMMRIKLAVQSGVSTGHDLNTPAFMSVDGLTTRATATVDADGNRSATSIDGT